jgi:hypothetical protein
VGDFSARDAVREYARLATPEQVTDLFEAGIGGTETYIRKGAIEALGSSLPPNLIRRALDEIDGFREERDRALALRAIAARLPEDELEAAFAMVCEIADDDSRTYALRPLALNAARAEPAVAHAILSRTLRRLAGRTRTSFLTDLASLAPLVVALGGAEAPAVLAECLLSHEERLGLGSM